VQYIAIACFARLDRASRVVALDGVVKELEREEDQRND